MHLDGFALWAKSSQVAFKSGRFLRTKSDLFEMPAESLAVRKPPGTESLEGIRQNAGVWFPKCWIRWQPICRSCLRTANDAAVIYRSFSLTVAANVRTYNASAAMP